MNLHKPIKDDRLNRDRNILIAIRNLIIQIGDPLNPDEATLRGHLYSLEAKYELSLGYKKKVKKVLPISKSNLV